MRLTGEEFDLNDMVVDPVEAEGLQSGTAHRFSIVRKTCKSCRASTLYKHRADAGTLAEEQKDLKRSFYLI